MKNNFQHKNISNLSFHAIENEELMLRFDCVIGSDVSHKFPLHIHNSLCIGLITKGTRSIVWSDKTTTVNQNEIFVINKNQPHAINQTEPHDYIAITIKGDLECVIFENVIQSSLCADLFMQFFNAFIEENISELPEKWNKLYDYLIRTHKLSDSLSFNEGFLRKSLEYIQDNYPHQISVADIAAYACMSTYHFSRLFKRLTGLTPHNYLKQYRLSKSYKHLQNNFPVFDTAIETGFYDSSHFIKTFYSYMAVSPKEYQESVRKQ